MKIAFIHATTTAVEPIDRAFQEIAPEIARFHVMDTGLLPLLQESGALTPAIINRFTRLLNLATETKVDAIQLTCSAFNDAVHILQPLYEVKLFRSDEAMLDQAADYDRVGLVSTVKETPEALIPYLKRKKPEIEVHSLVQTEAIRLLFAGKQEEHDRYIREMVYQLEGKVDVIVLSQYSMAHMAEELDVEVPILTGPVMSARRCIEYLRAKETSKQSLTQN